MLNHSFSPLIDHLIEALCRLPSIGPKSAQRLALHILQHDKSAGETLANALTQSIEQVGQCQHCRTLSETPQCRICASHKRDASLLCIVESPADILAIENTGSFSGLYFVLMGNLSPLDGIGPEELGIGLLEQRFQEGEISEVIIATSATMEGQATAHYIGELAKAANIKASRLAQGVPVGGELEYLDHSTLAHALQERREV